MLELTRARLQALAGAGLVLTLSHYMAQELAAAGLSWDKLRVIPPFVQGLTPPDQPQEPSHHLLACRLVERKGVLVALEAARLLPPEQPLVIAGHGPLAEAVALAASQSGGRLRYMGWASRRQMAELLAGAWSLWLPSLWAEPFGIAGLEALALGVPVAGSAVGGVGEWLEDGINGILVPAGQPQALAAAARELAGPRGRSLGRAGAARVARDYAADKMMERLWAGYQELAQSRA
jgi:glycosyltransferase involved in cell wall biosynthesis